MFLEDFQTTNGREPSGVEKQAVAEPYIQYKQVL